MLSGGWERLWRNENHNHTTDGGDGMKTTIQDKVLSDIILERKRQDEKWGIQNHDHFTWLSILGEEYGESQKAALENRFGNKSGDDYRKELIETAAVALAAVECYDRHTSGGVYLAGPIRNCSSFEVHNWRVEAAKLLHCSVINPALARDFSQTACTDCMNEIVNPDKNDIDSCAVLLANCWQISVGTSMEILYAWERGKLIICIVPEEKLLSAWTIAHAHKLFHTLEDACNYINTIGR